MKQGGRKWAALLLALSMALGLAACGSKGGDDKKQLSGTVYVPKFMDCKLNVDYINSGCTAGENVYIVGETHEETKETDPSTGEEYYQYESRVAIYRIPLEGGEAVELENYTAPQLPEGAEGNVAIQSLEPGADDTLWVTEYLYAYTFDLPEGFNPETDDQWAYQNYKESMIRRQLDATGNELTRLDVDGLMEKLEMEYISGMAFDGDGNSYVLLDGEIAVLDPQLNTLFSIKEEDLWGRMTLLADGSIGVLYSSYDQETETSTNQLRVIDREAKGWGTSYNMPLSTSSVFTGGGDYLFYYQNNDSIYGFKAGAAEGEKLFSWIDSDINRNEVAFFSFTDGGQVVAATQKWKGDSRAVELAVMTATDRSALPEKTTLTYGTMYLFYETRNKIIEFNKTSDKYRIQVQDYSEFNTGEDNSAGLTKLNTEIIAGNMPDILETTSLPQRQYGARGLLEDLWPFIENDPELGRGAVMERVLQADEQDGKLYEVFNSFYIQTVAGAASIVGDRMSWTLADLQEALSRMPEGCSIFGQSDTKDGMLRVIMAVNAGSFVDWSTGECRFDSDSFKTLLSFCNSFPAEFNWDKEFDNAEWEDENTRIASGKQMLSQTNISDLLWGISGEKAIFGGDVSFVGYPMEDGSVGSSFSSRGTNLAMSASCKDKEGAWSFIRQELLPREEDKFYDGTFYVNKADFEKAIAKAMEPNYERDGNGDPILDEDGNPIEYKDTIWISEDVEREIPRPTQAEYDQLMALYNAIDTMYYYDESIYNIVSDLAGAYFQGDRSLDETASQIQSRVKLYVNENR